jgi:hypothetical protein
MPRRRIPLWVTLVPLALGIGLWYLMWTGWRDRLAEALADVLPAGTEISIGGFPYRLEARTGPVALSHRDEALRLSLEARALAVNRQPWRLDRQVINLTAPRASFAIAPFPAIRAEVSAPMAQASLRFDGRRIARGSAVFEEATLSAGILRAPLRAARLEAHLRETPTRTKAPTLPTQAQLVVSADALRIGAGAPLALSAALDLAGSEPLNSVAGWRSGGAAELRQISLSDATGEILRASATLRADAFGQMVARGTVETVCPATLRAAAAGLPPVTEKRARKPVAIPFTAILGTSLTLAPPDRNKPPPPVRGQEPDCPRLS